MIEKRRSLVPKRVSGCEWEGVLVRLIALNISLGEPWARGTCNSGKGQNLNETTWDTVASLQTHIPSVRSQ